MSLMFSISGLRGIVDKDLTPEIIFNYAAVFGKYLNPGKIIIGRDARKSGKIFRRAVIQGLNSAGCTVIDLGIVPTPTVLFMVRKLKAHGGIAITASHNPVQWNALKFISQKGQFLDQREFKTFSKYLLRKMTIKQREKKTDKIRLFPNGVDNHIKKIISTLKPGVKRFKVGVDGVNGAGSIGLPRVLEEMGCKVYRLNCKFRPDFPRKPEPTPENIRGLCQFIKEKKLDMGFACDPDCDRLSIVDENGRAIGEENTLVLATDFILNKIKGNVVTNLSTSALMNYITKKYDCKLYRTKVGEANVVSKMRKTSAIIGGEGNGGVIYPEINFTRDALVGAALIVKLLDERNKKISEILATYPGYYMIKKKIKISKERFEKRKENIIKVFKGRLNFLDGLRITTKDYWLHIRPSKTEPLIRIIGEARNKKQIEEYIKKIRDILK
ncbi:phosphoglucosamine mutase [candidate division WOR-3 bacterium]|nr:phosphoglucosamine mutase [candidate division WOR-3 bacterium]